MSEPTAAAETTAPRARVRRDVVTPDDLNVNPALLGAPLASAGRRLMAISIDVIVVAMLSNLGNVWLLGGVVLLALPHLREPGPRDTPQRRKLLWALAAALIAAGAVQAWNERDAPDAHRPTASDERAAPDEAVAAAIAEAASATGGAALTPLQTAQARIATLQAELAQARRPKRFDWREQLHAWTDEIGLGLGWTIAYFSLLPVWWNGQTLGKRLFGLRIVELTGKPLTPLRAFKRYGGYAAGMATGFFGFLQVLWDPNRQAIQDKTAHTVVIDVRRKLSPAAPAPPTAPPDQEPR